MATDTCSTCGYSWTHHPEAPTHSHNCDVVLDDAWLDGQAAGRRMLTTAQSTYAAVSDRFATLLREGSSPPMRAYMLGWLEVQPPIPDPTFVQCPYCEDGCSYCDNTGGFIL